MRVSDIDSVAGLRIMVGVRHGMQDVNRVIGIAYCAGQFDTQMPSIFTTGSNNFGGRHSCRAGGRDDREFAKPSSLGWRKLEDCTAIHKPNDGTTTFARAGVNLFAEIVHGKNLGCAFNGLGHMLLLTSFRGHGRSAGDVFRSVAGVLRQRDRGLSSNFQHDGGFRLP